MARLSRSAPELIDLLIQTHPYEMASAAGIPDEISDKAIRELQKRAQVLADRLRSRRARRERLAAGRREYVKRVDRIIAKRDEVDNAAERAGMPPPLWRAFDPTEFGGDGRAVIRFDRPDRDRPETRPDPYQPETKVSWHIARVPIDQLGETLIRPALDWLDQQEAPAVAYVWIGNNTGLPWHASRNAFYSDHAEFLAAHEALAEIGQAEPLTKSRVYPLRSPSITVADRSRDNVLWVPWHAEPRVLGHRGAAWEYPEQSAAAIDEARRQGGRGVEIDVRCTKDK
jgi:hypothetical protein